MSQTAAPLCRLSPPLGHGLQGGENERMRQGKVSSCPSSCAHLYRYELLTHSCACDQFIIAYGELYPTWAVGSPFLRFVVVFCLPNPHPPKRHFRIFFRGLCRRRSFFFVQSVFFACAYFLYLMLHMGAVRSFSPYNCPLRLSSRSRFSFFSVCFVFEGQVGCAPSGHDRATAGHVLHH